MTLAQYNAVAWNASRYNNAGESDLPVHERSDRFRYTLELRDSTGDLVKVLRNWHDATWTQTLNEPDELVLSFPASEDDADKLTRPYQVWLYDQYGDLAQKFLARRPRTIRSGAMVERTVTCPSIMAQLLDEVIPSYETTVADGKTRAQIIAEWLALQANADPILLGNVSAAIGATVVAVSIEGKSILAALNELMDGYSSDSVLYVTPGSKRLNWVTDIGNRYREIRYRKNLIEIEREEDDSDFFTRLYLYGNGSGSERLSLLDAGQGNEYLDADTQGTYGIISRVITRNEIADADTLLDVATAILARCKAPRTIYRATALDLSQIAAGYEWEALEVGSVVRVIDEAFAPTPLNIESRVVSIERPLDDPTSARIVLENQPRNIEDLLSEILRRLDVVETVDIFDPDDPTPPPADLTGVGDPGVSPYAMRADAEIPLNIFPPVGDPDYLPEPTDPTTPQAGTSDYAARADHVHVGGAGGGGGTPYDSTPEAVATTGAAGASSYYARGDHKHAPWIYGARMFSVADYAALTALTITDVTLKDGDFAYVEDVDRLFCRTAGTWRIRGQFVATSAPTGIGEGNGDLWYDSTNHRQYVNRGGQWVALAHYWPSTTKPVDANSKDGDLWLNTSTSVLYYKANSYWWPISHLAAKVAV